MKYGGIFIFKSTTTDSSIKNNKRTDNMPCVVLTDKIIIVKSKWVENVNSAEARISGTPPNVLVKIFHSSDENEQPDFQLEPQEDEDQGDSYVEYGYVLKICGECMRSQRIIQIT